MRFARRWYNTGMREISGVVFDFGGVMTLTTMPERVRAITEELGVPWQG